MYFNVGFRRIALATGIGLGVGAVATLHAAPADPAFGALTLVPTRSLVGAPHAPTHWEQAEARRLTAQLASDQVARAVADLLARRADREATPAFDAPAAFLSTELTTAPVPARARPDDSAPLPDAAPVTLAAAPAVFAADRSAGAFATGWSGALTAAPAVVSADIPATHTSARTFAAPVDNTGPGAGGGFPSAGGGSAGVVPESVGAPAVAAQPSLVRAWGYNNVGQLGNGTTTNSTSPVSVSPNGSFTGTNVTALAAGDLHSLALQGGAVYAWGYNSSGQLGNNSNDPEQRARGGEQRQRVHQLGRHRPRGGL